MVGTRRLLPLCVLAGASCHEAPRRPEPPAAVAAAPATASPGAPVLPDGEALPLVVFLGDSLTAGLDLAEEDAYPARLARRLAQAGHPVRVVNAGVSGDTTAGGLARLDWLLAQKPDVLVVELGANDGLRGQPLDNVRANLRAVLARAKAQGVRCLLVGMRMPPSLGTEYTEGFARIYPELAREAGVPLVPFLLDGVAGRRELNLPDGMHPNADGHERLAANVQPELEKLVAEAAVRARSTPER